jgi:uncharacterized protein YqfA (UPF0365 family)
MSLIQIILLAALALFIILAYVIPLSTYLVAVFSGVNIGIVRMISMRFRSVPARPIVLAFITAQKAGIPIELDQLEAHYLAGGDVFEVVRAMIMSKKNGIELDFMTASKANLAGVKVFDNDATVSRH